MSTTTTTTKQQQQQLAMLTVEMRWHFRGSSEEAVESVDFHPRYGDLTDNGPVIGRLCTAGLDGVARIWEIPSNTEELVHQAFTEKVSHDYSFVRHVASLERENADSISCFAARWSPCGQFVATAYSDGIVKVWCYDAVASAQLAQDEEVQVTGVEKWKDINTYRGPHHDISEIVDVAFTRDSSHVCFVCNSGYVMVFSLKPGSAALHVFAKPEAHTNALGLAMDPLGLLFGTTGSDTRLQFYDTTSLIKSANSAALANWTLGKNASADKRIAETGTVLDAVLGHGGGPFFRRSSWSPDGGMAAFPFGRVFSAQNQKEAQSTTNNNNEDGAEEDNNNNNNNMMMMMMNNHVEVNTLDDIQDQQQPSDQQQVSGDPVQTAIRPPSGADCVTSSVVFVFRAKLNRVAAAITVKDTTAIAGCKFAPKLFEAFEEDTKDPSRAKAKGAWGPLTYRYAIAVWTYRTVIIYTSDCSARHSSFSDLHYAKINDVAWTPRCRLLAVASEDQTVSIISLADTLGQPVALRTIRESMPEYLVPPMVLVADTLLEVMTKRAEENEAATLELVNNSAGRGGVNKAVGVKKRERRRDRDAATAKKDDEAVANVPTTSDGEKQQQGQNNNQNEQQQQQQPAAEAASEDELLAAMN